MAARHLPCALLLLLAAAPATAAAATARPGTLDRTFGNRGAATTRLLDGGWAAARDRGGRILVAGGIAQPGVLRLTARGRRDRRFGTRGVATAEGRDLLPLGIRRHRDGTIRVATATTTTDTPPVELLRYGPSGGRRAGRVHATPFSGPIVDGVQRRDGGAYVASLGREIRAVDPDGSLDERFGGGTVSPFAARDLSDLVLALRPNGRLLVSGHGTEVLQLLPDGRPDPAFGGGDGRAAAPLVPAALRVLRDGDVVGAGQPGAFRLSRSGRLRRGFGARGTLRWERTPLDATVFDVAEDGRGRLYFLNDEFGVRSSVVRAYNRAGRRIRRFGRRGIAELPDPPRFAVHRGERLLVVRRGLLVVGARYEDGSSHPAFGCDFREDLCAAETHLAVWRLRR